MKKLLTLLIMTAVWAVMSAQTAIEISNPSFESGTTGWTTNMARQSNNAFTRKQGTYYLETWVDRGKAISDSYVRRTMNGLQDGNYTLKVYALHIQQNASSSTANTGKAQTGAYLYAGIKQTPITSMKQYTLKFSVVDGESSVEIGVKAENATGNWLCVDNFTLTYDSELTMADYANVVQTLVDQGNALLEQGIQNSVADPLRQAIDNATGLISQAKSDEQPSDPDALYEQLKNAKTELTSLLEDAKASRTLYDNLQARIDYAKKVLGWWENFPKKSIAVNLLVKAIETAEERLTNYDLERTDLVGAVNSLNNRINSVDKKTYASSSACGTDTQLKNNNNQWSYTRSYQSKHWILFWEKGYGNSVPSAVPEILSTADKVFEFYADSLKFITINENKSKTDTYKMIIRLKYTDEWEANGSGIDDKIGMLTLSRWAYTSRGGQTVAHEIGHCFQYQTHCDNNNQNGWMYTWVNSGNGNVFWEMCAQWQAYKFYPTYQFNNEWLTNTLNGLHKHPLCEELRYNNYFIQDYFCHKHGMDVIGRLWNESVRLEDPFQTYMRITMDSELTQAEKLEQLNEEMWEYGARLTTFDMDPIRRYGNSTIGKRTQTTLKKVDDGFWKIDSLVCVENFGNNAIRLNVPAGEKTVYAELIGLPDEKGYISYKSKAAGWKFGFVALKKDGTRLYGDIAGATYDDTRNTVSFDCPAGCSYLWLVVSGAPTDYWSRGWNGTTRDDEQLPYKVKFYQTNVYGNPNNDSLPVGIDEIAIESQPVQTDSNIYSLSGQLIRRNSTSLDGLRPGIYIINGKKVMVR